MNNYEVTMIETKNLSAHPDNPRKDLGDISELAESIKEKGVLQPLIVVPWFSTLTREPAEDDSMSGIYTIVAGHRRHAAAKLAGLEELPCIITDMDRHEQIETMLLENIQRSDLTYLEQAEGFQMMIDLGTSVEELSERTGFAKSTIYHRIKILELDDEVKTNDQIRMNDYVAAEAIEDVDERNKFLQEYGGSKNFDFELKRALKIQFDNERKDKIIKILQSLGAINKFTNSWEKGVGIVKRLDYLSDDVLSEVEKLTTKDVEGLFFCEETYGFQIRLYKIDAVEKEERPKEASPEVEERNRRKKGIDDLTKDLKARIEEHVKLVVDTEPPVMLENREEVIKGALKFFLLDGTYIGPNSLEEFYDTSRCDEDESEDKLLDKFIEEKSTEQIMLIEVCSVISWWNFMNYNGPYYYTDNGFTKRGLFDLLELTGFAINDDDRKLADGTHELYMEE